MISDTVNLEKIKEEFFHFPVMVREVLSLSGKVENKTLFVDATLGAGGHTYFLYRFTPYSFMAGFERDDRMVQKLKDNLDKFQVPYSVHSDVTIPMEKDRVNVYQKRFSNIKELVNHHNQKINFLLCDLGISIYHMKENWGFSFDDTALDMRLDPESKDTGEILNTYSEKEIAWILKQYGEEKFAGIIAKEIVKNRPVTSGRQLKEIIIRSYYKKLKTRIHERVVQRSFQALRIYSNEELKELEILLASLPGVMDKGGISVFISFHSLEDRLVKKYYKHYEQEGNVILTKKPLTPAFEEIRVNPASRSAKMRAMLWMK